MSSCDVLESDNDVLTPVVDVNGKEIYVLANGESFIDVQSKVQTKIGHEFVCPTYVYAFAV